jgi:hypothetical protein
MRENGQKDDHLNRTIPGNMDRGYTTVSFDELLSGLRRLKGDASVPEVVILAKAATEAEFIEESPRTPRRRSGFVLFHEIDHGGWLPRFGINRRVVRWILGNPLTAITIIRHDITAAYSRPSSSW